MGQTAQPVLEGGMRPWCPLHGVTPVSAVGPHSGYSPWDGFWEGGPQAFGTVVLAQGLGRSDAEPRPWGAPGTPQNKARVGVQGTEGRAGGHNTGDTTTGNSRTATHTPDTIAPAPRQPRHRHAPTRFPPTCTHAQHRHRAVPTLPSRTEPYRPYRAVPDLTEPHGSGALPPRAPIHSPTRGGNEPRAPRAGSAAPRWPRPSPRA